MEKKGIKQWTNKNKNSLFVGVVGSLIWQILVFTSGYIPQAGINVIRTLENMIYFNSSAISSASMINLLFSMILGVFLFGGTYRIIDFIVDKILNKLKKKQSNNTDISKIGKKILNNLQISFMLLFLLLGLNMISFNLKIKYDLDMISIKPYISEMEFNKLNSKWIQMKEKNDYREIYKVIKRIQEENQLKTSY